MQLIAADIGNSSTKIAVEYSGDDDRWSTSLVFRGNQEFGDDFQPLDSKTPAFWSISNVNAERLSQLANWVAAHRPDDRFHVIAPSEVPLKSDIESRDQLGIDRLIAAWMATVLNDQSGPLIVVDAGTAVTIDYVDANEVFRGGVIFPGAGSNFRQLSNDTDALPNLERSKRVAMARKKIIGRSTHEAIIQGVFQSQIAAIQGIVARMAKISKQTTSVYVTGGGIADIIDRLPEDWNDVPDLVLQGAKTIGARLVNESSDAAD